MMNQKMSTNSSRSSSSSSTKSSFQTRYLDSLDPDKREELENRLKDLISAFQARTSKAKEKLQAPPTPSSDESDTDGSIPQDDDFINKLKDLMPSSPDDESHKDAKYNSLKDVVMNSFNVVKKYVLCNYVLDPNSRLLLVWLAIMAIAFSYNAWVIPLRIVFPFQNESNEMKWLLCDILVDIIYALDIFAFKSHIKFISNGFWVTDSKETRLSYYKSKKFKVDTLSLIPFDLVSAFFYKNLPVLRIPRLMKIQSYWEFFRKCDAVLSSPHSVRIMKTIFYMLYMIHINACAYYGLSSLEGIGTTTWTFDGKGSPYIRCFYFATKTATSIGKNPKPSNELEYSFMTFAWLSGVFVFALLIGQIRDIIATATKTQTEYQVLLYEATNHLNRLGTPKFLQDKVKLWLSYTWEQQKTIDEDNVLNLLPKKMRMDLALNMHVETLSKVKLFQNCETSFLRELVIQLKSIIFLPNDFVCKKGEIGREMFIIKSGKVNVLGGPKGNTVLATLGRGSVFGEIALLGIGGMNTRTADVRSAGFSNLFVLSKADLNETIKDYPKAQEVMKKTAKKLMKETARKAKQAQSEGESDSDTTFSEAVSNYSAEIIIHNKKDQPKLLKAVLEIFPSIGRQIRKNDIIKIPKRLNSNESIENLSLHSTSSSTGKYFPSSSEMLFQTDDDASIFNHDVFSLPRKQSTDSSTETASQNSNELPQTIKITKTFSDKPSRRAKSAQSNLCVLTESKDEHLLHSSGSPLRSKSSTGVLEEQKLKQSDFLPAGVALSDITLKNIKKKKVTYGPPRPFEKPKGSTSIVFDGATNSDFNAINPDLKDVPRESIPVFERPPLYQIVPQQSIEQYNTRLQRTWTMSSSSEWTSTDSDGYKASTSE